MDPNERLEKLRRLKELRDSRGSFESGGEQFDFDAGSMVSNAPSSAKQLVHDTVAPIIHPVDTIKGVIKMAEDPTVVIDHFKNRYGSLENMQRTLEQDPMGVISDALGVATGGATLAGRLPGARKVPRSIMESTTKFPTTVSRKDRKRNIDVMLKERITPDQKGIDKLNNIVNEVNIEIESILMDSELSGKRISTSRVVQPLNQLIAKKIESIGPDRQKDIAQLRKLKREFNESVKGQGTLTPNQAQKLKKDLFETINFDRGNTTSTLAGEQGRKALATGAREEVAALDPQIDALNQRQAPLLDMSQDLDRAANRIDNRNNASGIGTFLGGGIGGTVGGFMGAPGTGAVAGMAVGKAVTSPKVAMRSAIMIERLIDMGHSPASAAIIMQQMAQQAGRLRENR